jgi:polysaccharide export outer membrane protein
MTGSTPVVTPVDPDYLLQPGDLLNIQVAPAQELSRETLLQPDGTLVFPLVGTLIAAGLTPPSLERLLAQKLQIYVMKPSVRVTIRRFSMDSVCVIGKVNRAGPVTYRSGMRILTVVSEAGGFAEDADRAKVLVHRGPGADRKTYTVDAQAVMSSSGTVRDFPLIPGDIVDVQGGGDRVSILGQVGRPGSYPQHEGSTLLELLSAAGGITQGAKAKSVYIYRQNDAGRKPLRVNLARIMKGHPEDDIPLQRGDIVMVPEGAFYAGAGTASTLLTPWFYLATMVIAIVVATKH